MRRNTSADDAISSPFLVLGEKIINVGVLLHVSGKKLVNLQVPRLVLSRLNRLLRVPHRVFPLPWENIVFCFETWWDEQIMDYAQKVSFC
ncbi:hypothetical protein CDAR_211741 [Caerostris darwini]|uniref:Uncharacterized protein n=1 Tax=Caerostris darwini TaxID=1538125 RepID=A0AAV4PCN6_9ARAC|nr:hypothetical protein CDAR_211741 [Caerostris darwini]